MTTKHLKSSMPERVLLCSAALELPILSGTHEYTEYVRADLVEKMKEGE